MTRTPSQNDPEEARKELLATLHASRELGPAMDDTLADRFMDQLAGLRPEGSFDQATTRASLQALLKSAQGSDPVGDDALVATFFAGIQPPKPSVPAYAPYGAPPASVEFGPLVRIRGGSFAQYTPMIVMAAIFIVALIVSQGRLWWLFWLIPAAVGWGRRGRYQQRQLYRDQRRAYRHDRVLGRDEVYRPLPPSRPPEIL
jgi:hypothetical protein